MTDDDAIDDMNLVFLCFVAFPYQIGTAVIPHDEFVGHEKARAVLTTVIAAFVALICGLGFSAFGGLGGRAATCGEAELDVGVASAGTTNGGWSTTGSSLARAVVAADACEGANPESIARRRQGCCCRPTRGAQDRARSRERC